MYLKPLLFPILWFDINFKAEIHIFHNSNTFMTINELRIAVFRIAYVDEISKDKRKVSTNKLITAVKPNLLWYKDIRFKISQFYWNIKITFSKLLTN